MIKQVCNFCGKDFDMWDKQEAFGLHHHVGYGSEFDGSYIDVDMCCSCFDKLMNTYVIPNCKISPVKEGGEV